MSTEMIRRIDDFLIDRCFQPIADMWSCYAIAAFLFTGAIIAMLAAIVADHSARSVGAAILAGVWVFRLVEINHMDTNAPSDVLPVDRIREAFWRPFYVVFCIVDLIDEIFLRLDVHQWLFNQGWLLNTLAVYFMACRKRPPMRRAIAALGVKA